MIIRTAAEGASEEELTRDVNRLTAQWEVIQKKAESTSNAPTLLYGEPDLAIRVIRDVFNEDFKELVVQGDDAWDTVEAYVAHVSPELTGRLIRATPARATSSTTCGSTSSWPRRSTARCGCPRAARWSSTAPRR